MTRLLLAVVAWRFVRRFAAAAIIIAVAMPLLYRGSFAHHRGGEPAAVEGVVRPIERALQDAVRKAFRR